MSQIPVTGHPHFQSRPHWPTIRFPGGSRQFRDYLEKPWAMQEEFKSSLMVAPEANRTCSKLFKHLTCRIKIRPTSKLKRENTLTLPKKRVPEVTHHPRPKSDNWSHLVHFAIFRRRDFDSCLAHTGTGWNTTLSLHKLARSTHQGVVKDALRVANIHVLWSSGSFSMNLKAPLDICWTGFHLPLSPASKTSIWIHTRRRSMITIDDVSHRRGKINHWTLTAMNVPWIRLRRLCTCRQEVGPWYPNQLGCDNSCDWDFLHQLAGIGLKTGML